MKMRSYYLGELTWPDMKEFLAVHDLAVVPVGSCEQHGPHLPMGFPNKRNKRNRSHRRPRKSFKEKRRSRLEAYCRKACRFAG